jgi:RND family efflux transporter MFP subunit
VQEGCDNASRSGAFSAGDVTKVTSSSTSRVAAMTSTGTLAARLLGLRLILTLAMAGLLVHSAAAQQQPAPDALEYKGTVAAAREGEVAPQLDGLLSKINFTAGQSVKKGDLLFEFAPRDKELTLVLAQATLKQAQAQLRLAEVNLKNAQTLRTRNVGSEMQLLEAEAQRDIAAAKAEEAQAKQQLAELDVQRMKLYAPISGIISRPFIKEGAYITKEAREQSRLATIVQLDPIHVVGQAPAATYFQRSEMRKSLERAEQQEFGLVLPTGDKYPHKGRQVADSHELNPATQTVEVTVEFPNPDYSLRPGLNVRALPERS